MAGLSLHKPRLGIYGGTFDPPHVAHLMFADEARFQFSLDKVLWLLTPDPPHKGGWDITPVELRLVMLESAIKGQPFFDVSREDFARPSPQFAVDTMKLLRKKYPNLELYYLMGSDSLRDLPTWERPNEFLSNCDGLVVMNRPREDVKLNDLSKFLPDVGEKVNFVDAPMIEVSAKEIRKRVKAGLPFRYYVPEGVYKIIQEKNLYK